jgi:hypothetical protein
MRPVRSTPRAVATVSLSAGVAPSTASAMLPGRHWPVRGKGALQRGTKVLLFVCDRCARFTNRNRISNVLD